MSGERINWTKQAKSLQTAEKGEAFYFFMAESMDPTSIILGKSSAPQMPLIGIDSRKSFLYDKMTLGVEFHGNIGWFSCGEGAGPMLAEVKFFRVAESKSNYEVVDEFYHR